MENVLGKFPSPLCVVIFLFLFLLKVLRIAKNRTNFDQKYSKKNATPEGRREQLGLNDTYQRKSWSEQSACDLLEDFSQNVVATINSVLSLIRLLFSQKACSFTQEIVRCTTGAKGCYFLTRSNIVLNIS